jgi:zinc transporter 1/2/3
LLAPANDALNNLCLTGPITEYDWVEGIALMTVFAFFSIHFFALQRRPESRDQVNGNANPNPNGNIPLNNQQNPPHLGDGAQPRSPLSSYYPVELLSVLILEFGILFHSVFIGLTLAVAGDEFSKLYVVIVFHQFFEGVGLGSRLEKNLGDHKRTKYVMALMYTFITPIAISIGLGVRARYQPGSQRALVVNGICDSISAGILIYTGLVDLMANEFLYGTVKPVYPIPAFASMCLGACKNIVFHKSEMDRLLILPELEQSSWPFWVNGRRFIGRLCTFWGGRGTVKYPRLSLNKLS